MLNHNGKVEESHRLNQRNVDFSRLTQNVYVFLSVSGHQQPVQLAEGGPAAALGSGRPQTGSLHRVRGGRAGAAGVRFRTGRPLAGLHLVSSYLLHGLITASAAHAQHESAPQPAVMETFQQSASLHFTSRPSTLRSPALSLMQPTQEPVTVTRSLIS